MEDYILGNLRRGSVVCNDVGQRSEDGIFHRVLLVVQILWCILLVLPYLVFILSCRYIFKVRNQSPCDHNRAKLAMSDKDLCEAQKKRIEKSSLAVDAFVFLLASACILMRIFVFDQCNLQIQCKMACVYQPYLPALPFYFACALGIVLKTCVMASEYDYSPVSQEMEAFLSSRIPSNPVMLWIQSAEKRQSILMPMWLMFTTIIILFMAYIESISTFDVVFQVCGILEWCFGSLLIITDGGFIHLMWTVFHTISSPSKGKRDEVSYCMIFPKEFTNPLKLRSFPKRKAIIGLALMIWLLCLTSMTGLSVDAHNSGTLISYVCLYAWSICLLVCIFLTSDRETNVKELLSMNESDNFGLVMSRLHMLKELQRVLLECSRAASSREVIEVRIPTYLASQARVELALVISYRWSDEKMYRRKLETASVGKCFILRNLSCDGFDWNVILIQNQVEALVLDLSKASEDYVWMDQFCLPQMRQNVKSEIKRRKDG